MAAGQAGACPGGVEVALLGRRPRLVDGGPDRAGEIQEIACARPADGYYQAGECFEGFDEHPSVSLGVDELKSAGQVVGGHRPAPCVDIETSQVHVRQRDGRPGARLLSGFHRHKGVATSGAAAPQTPGYGGKAVGDGALGWPVAQVPEQVERLATGA